MSTSRLASVEVADHSNLEQQNHLALQPVHQPVTSIPDERPQPTETLGIDENNGPFAEVVTPQQAWNDPKINIWRVAAAFLGFMIMGANDACYGPLLPSLERYFSLSYTVVSLVFLTPFVGYITAAFLSDRIHMLLGQRGVALIAPNCRLVSYIVLAVRPPYPVVLISLVFAGFGNGLIDAAWNAFVGDLKDANQLLGIIHGFYGLGATLAPLIATAMVTRYGLEWNTFFFPMVGVTAIECALSIYSFWSANAAEYRKYNANSNAAGGRMRAALNNRVTWICSPFSLAYVGSEGLPFKTSFIV